MEVNNNYALAINTINILILIVLTIMVFYHGKRQQTTTVNQYNDPHYYFFTISLFLLAANAFALYRSINLYLLSSISNGFGELINLTTFSDRSLMLFAYCCLLFFGKNFDKLNCD